MYYLIYSKQVAFQYTANLMVIFAYCLIPMYVLPIIFRWMFELYQVLRMTIKGDKRTSRRSTPEAGDTAMEIPDSDIPSRIYDESNKVHSSKSRSRRYPRLNRLGHNIFSICDRMAKKIESKNENRPVDDKRNRGDEKLLNDILDGLRIYQSRHSKCEDVKAAASFVEEDILRNLGRLCPSKLKTEYPENQIKSKKSDDEDEHTIEIVNESMDNCVIEQNNNDENESDVIVNTCENPKASSSSDRMCTSDHQDKDTYCHIQSANKPDDKISSGLITGRQHCRKNSTSCSLYVNPPISNSLEYNEIDNNIHTDEKCNDDKMSNIKQADYTDTPVTIDDSEQQSNNIIDTKTDDLKLSSCNLIQHDNVVPENQTESLEECNENIQLKEIDDQHFESSEEDQENISATSVNDSMKLNSLPG